MDNLKIFLIVGAVVLTFIVIAIVCCLIKRCKKRTIQNDSPRGSYHIVNSYDVEAPRGTHTTRSSSACSNNPQQQSFPQQNKPRFNASSSGHHTTRGCSVCSNNLRHQSLPQQNKPQQGWPQQNKPQQGWPQQNIPQFSASSSGTRPVQVVLPSHQQQEDIHSSEKFTQYAKIDLHQFTLKEAMMYFKMFLIHSINEYSMNPNSRKNRFIEVITGRGNHCPDGIPVIKPAVEDYLITHQYKYVWANPGMVRIDLLSSAHRD